MSNTELHVKRNFQYWLMRAHPHLAITKMKSFSTDNYMILVNKTWRKGHTSISGTLPKVKTWNFQLSLQLLLRGSIKTRSVRPIAHLMQRGCSSARLLACVTWSAHRSLPGRKLNGAIPPVKGSTQIERDRQRESSVESPLLEAHCGKCDCFAARATVQIETRQDKLKRIE